MSGKQSQSDFLSELTWDDLHEWAGAAAVAHGKSYQQDGSVEGLASTADGGIIAWVRGARKYATLVKVAEGELVSACTCPYGGDCKHAVAVVLEYLEHVKRHVDVPSVTARDRRLALIDQATDAETYDEDDEEDAWGEDDKDAAWGEDDEDDDGEEDDDGDDDDEGGASWEEGDDGEDDDDGDGWGEDDDEEDDDDDDEEGEDDEDVTRGRKRRSFPGRPGNAVADTVCAFLEDQTKQELIALLEYLAGSFPDVREALQDRRDLSVGAVAELVDAVREEIYELSEEQGWSDVWDGGGHTPDYSRVRGRLEALLSGGYADEVVSLGEELLDAGTRQVELCDDEGETASEISSCMDIVFRALPHSSLPPADQMLWAVEADLKDQFGLCEGANAFWEQERTARDWNTLAGRLEALLDKRRRAKGKGRSSTDYCRYSLTDWLIDALEHAGRQEEIIPLCEREAEENQGYQRVVDTLMEAGRTEDAEKWIHKGIRATLKELPGIASELRQTLRTIREESNEWLGAAALQAEDFLQEPAVDTFHALQEASERADVWPAVRAALMHYLETGEIPHAGTPAANGQTPAPWPLPESHPAEVPPRLEGSFPMADVLIDIAIAEERPDDVLRWYDRSGPGATGGGRSGGQADRVAGAVAGAYPERAIAIWRKLAEAQIAQTHGQAYETAAGYLRKLHRLLKELGREDEWQRYLDGIRRANARKRLLLEILDGIGGGRIIG